MKKHSISNWCQLIEKANSDIEWYWNAVNEDLGIKWFRKYDKTYDSQTGIPWTKWFLNGKCNIVVNAIDRHAKKQPDKVAYIFANEQGSKKITYRELDEQVSRLADALTTAGVKKGDVIAIYLPMIPEAFYAIFACSRSGLSTLQSFQDLARMHSTPALLIPRQSCLSPPTRPGGEARRLILQANGKRQYNAQTSPE
jgi:acetyl-CoA synthetase